MPHFIFFSLFSLPLLLSFYYSYDNSLTWLGNGLLALLLMATAIFGLAYRLKNTLWRFFSALLPLLLIFLLELTQLVSFFLQGEGFNNRFFFHFNPQLFFNSLTLYPWLSIAIAALLSVFLFNIYVLVRRPLPFNLGPKAPVLFFLILLGTGVASHSTWQDFLQVYRDNSNSVKHMSLDEIEALGLNTKAISQTLAPAIAGKNLVLIYLESLDQIYLENSIFPNLTSNLQAYRQIGLDFPNIEQTAGTRWTIAGILASQCGTPLINYSGIGGNDILQCGFLEKGICLGDILHQAGYQQTYMGGASSQFAGKGAFFQAHQYGEVLGREELSPHLADPSYLNSWGLYDDSLFELAAKKYAALANTGKPFNLTLLTLDTHHPAGHASKSCKAYTQDNTMLAAVHCSDQLLTQFLQRISQHPAYENTIVALVSDHLALRNHAEPFYPKDYQRKLFFTLLNTGKSGVIEHRGFHMDIAPTLLAALGVQHQQQFLLGDSLLTDNFPERLQRISKRQMYAFDYINSHYFSPHFDTAVCRGNHMLQTNGPEHQKIRIGGKSITLNFSGQGVNKNAWPNEQVVLIFVDKQGNMRRTKVIHHKALPYYLAQASQNALLVIAKHSVLPQRLQTTQAPTDDFAVLFVHEQKKPNYVGFYTHFNQIQITTEDCQAKLEMAMSAELLETTQAKLCSRPEDKIAQYLADEEILSLPKVLTVHGLLYQAKLKRLDSEHFRLLSFEPLNEPTTPNTCLSYYDGKTLEVLAADIEGQRHQLTLHNQSSWANNALEFSLDKTAVSWFP